MRNFFFFMMEYCADVADMCLFYIMLRPICSKNQKIRNALLTILALSQIYIFTDFELLDSVSPLLCFVMSMIWVVWGIIKVKGKNIKMVLFQVIATTVIIILTNSMFICIPVLLGKTSFCILVTKTSARFIFMFLAKICSFLLAYIILHYLRGSTVERYSSFFCFIIVLSGLYIINSYYLMGNVDNVWDITKKIELNTLKSMFSIGLFMLIMIYLLLKILKRGQQVNTIQDENHLHKQILNEQKKAIKSIRKKQHEYKNNMESIHALLLEQDLKTARALMDELLNQNRNTDKIIRKNATFIQIMIDYKLKEAAEKQVTISKQITIGYDIPIDEYDIAIIINNAMNNAMESCEKLPASRRYIKCIIHTKLNYLNFYFENPCKGNLNFQNGRLATTKKNQLEHGIGIQNIENVVNKYYGMINYYSENEVFYLKCSLLIPDEKSE